MTILAPEPRTTIDLATVFRVAADVIERNGLAKGQFVAPPAVPDAHGVLHASDPQFRPVDMVGAIRIACGEDPERPEDVPDVPVVAAALEFASLHMRGLAPWTDGRPDYIEHLADFTDVSSRTALEVSACLVRLAVEAQMAVAS